MYILKLLVILLLLIPMQIEARRVFAETLATSTKEMPFIVGLSIAGISDKGKKVLTTCTGTYIRPLWVITATHCIEPDFPKADHKPIYDVMLCMGEVNPKKCPKVSKRLAKGVYPHTSGKVEYNEHDVCLISIEKPWPSGPTIQIAKLPTQKVDLKIYHQKECLTGIDETYRDTPLKQAIAKPYVGDRHICPVEGGKRGDGQICCQGVTGMTCHGDSGGPLFCQGVVIGVLKGGMGPDTCNDTTDRTSYYSLIQEYNDWIVRIAGPAAGGSRIIPNNLCLSVVYGTLFFLYFKLSMY